MQDEFVRLIPDPNGKDGHYQALSAGIFNTGQLFVQRETGSVVFLTEEQEKAQMRGEAVLMGLRNPHAEGAS